MKKIMINLTGQKFGKLTVIDKNRAEWLCICVEKILQLKTII